MSSFYADGLVADKENTANVQLHGLQPAAASKGILRKGTVTFSTPSKSVRRSVSEHKPPACSVAPLLQKSAVLASALTAVLHGDTETQDATSDLYKFSSFSSAKQLQASWTAPRPLAGTQGEDGGKLAFSPDEHAFSADVTSLAEIFGGTGISEKRLGTEAAGMRKSSAQGFRQLREKRSSIFKGAIRVVKTPLTTPVSSFRESSIYSRTAPPSSIYSRTAAPAGSGGTGSLLGSLPPPSLLASATTASTAAGSLLGDVAGTSGAAPRVSQALLPTSAPPPRFSPAKPPPVPCTPTRAHTQDAASCTTEAGAGCGNYTLPPPTPPTSALAPPAMTPRSHHKLSAAMPMTPRSHHKGTSGFGGKASMTPCNARAKGVASVVGSLLAKASLSAKASRLNHTQELQPPAALNDDEQVQAALPQRAAALNPSQAVEAGGRELVWGHEELGKGVEAAACPPSLLPPPPAQQQSVAQQPQQQQLRSDLAAAAAAMCPHIAISVQEERDTRVEKGEGSVCSQVVSEVVDARRSYRSRKSLILAQARRRVGVASPDSCARRRLGVASTPTNLTNLKLPLTNLTLMAAGHGVSLAAAHASPTLTLAAAHASPALANLHESCGAEAVTGSRWEAATLASSEEALTHLDSGLAYPRPLHPEALTCASSEQPLTFTPTTTSTGARREGIDTECAGGQLLESSGARARDELISAQRPKCVEAEVEEAAGAGRDKGPVAGAATAPQDKLPLERQKNLCHGSSASSAHTHADDHQGWVFEADDEVLMVVHKRTGVRTVTAAASDTHIYSHTDVHEHQNVGTRTRSGGGDGGGWVSRVRSSPRELCCPTTLVQPLSSPSSASLSPARTDGIFALLAAAAGPRQSRQAPQAYSEAPAKDWEAAGGWTDGHCRERAPNPVCGISATRSFASDASEHAHAPTHFLLPLLSPGPMAVSSEMVVMVAAASQVTKPTSKRARPTHLGPLNLFLSTTMSLPNYLPHVTSHTNCLPQICHRPTTIHVFSHTSCVFADTSQRERK